ncbi:MAG TPA: peptidylprolyl isomerase, partial [Planctomycetota bacterium]|nr:peptidylprolyl isomerase [Planctomycetota bacterium]
GGVVADQMVAKVNRAVITRSDVDKRLGTRPMSAEQREQAFRTVLLELVQEQIKQDAVTRVGLYIPQRYVDEQLEKQKEDLAKKGDDFQAYLSELAVTEEAYREGLSKDLTRQVYTAAAAGGFRSAQFRPDYWPDPTAEDVRSYYRRRLSEEFTLKNRARLFAIGLPFAQFPADAGRPVDERTREVADQIRQKLETGADFATLARQYSRMDQFRPDRGGDLGWLEAETSGFDPVIRDFAFKLEPRKLSEPIVWPPRGTPRALVLLWVQERVEERVRPFEEAQEEIREKLRRANLAVAQRRLEAKLLQEAYIWPPDLKHHLMSRSAAR